MSSDISLTVEPSRYATGSHLIYKKLHASSSGYFVLAWNSCIHVLVSAMFVWPNAIQFFSLFTKKYFEFGFASSLYVIRKASD